MSEKFLNIRRCALMAAATGLIGDQMDFLPADDGVVLSQDGLKASWSELATAVGDRDPFSGEARWHMAHWLKLRHWGHQEKTLLSVLVPHHARIMALPKDHFLHPGSGWAIGEVPGGALDLGVGLIGVRDDASEKVALPLPAQLADIWGIDVRRMWGKLIGDAHKQAGECAARLEREGRDLAVIRPYAGVDALTLMSLPALRRQIAASDRVGMRTVSAPTRTRAWFDSRHVDAPFIAAAWAATDEHQRGVAQALLVTKDTVSLPRTA